MPIFPFGRGANPAIRLPHAAARKRSGATIVVRNSSDVKAARKAITDRLGLPASASNQQVLRAVDALKPTKPAAGHSPTTTTAKNEEDALYERIFGTEATAELVAAEQDLYERVYPA